MNPVISRLFVPVDCPLCGCGEFSVLLPSRYRDDISEAELRRLYSASSDHILLDQVVRCRACELIYVNPRIDAQILIEAYSEAADPTFVAQNPERIATFRRVLSGVCRRFGIAASPERRILDVGCAGGAFPKAASDLGFRVTGVEPSAWLAEYGRREYQLDIREGVLEAGMFPAASFDLVTMWDVIEHLANPREILTILFGLLREGGWLIVNYPDAGSLAARLMGFRWPFWLSVHLLYYTRATMSRQLERAGFEVLHMGPHWQKLKVSYLLFRASRYISLASRLQSLADATPLGRLAVTYNMGQTLVVARKKR